MMWPFSRKPDRAADAELRDRCIIAETKAVFLESEVERLRRPKRERRRDAANVVAAKHIDLYHKREVLRSMERTAGYRLHIIPIGYDPA